MPVKNIFIKLNEYRKLQKMEYIYDQQGILNRYVREKENWDKHIHESKEFILKSAQTKAKGKVVILGSGWWLDLPIEELSKMFKEVILIDIIHPVSIRRRASKFPNVNLLNEDITGGLIDLFYKKLKKKNRIIPVLDSFNYSLPKDADFVISLNILCQLHIILVDYIKTFNLYTDKELKEINKFIQLSHINMLPKNKSCLITDIEEEILDLKDKIVGVNPLILVDLPEGYFSKKWQWMFDSMMTYREDYKTYFNTQAIDF